MIIYPVIHVSQKLINVVDLWKVAIHFSKLFYWICVFNIFFSFLFRHFTIVDEPTVNLNFYNYSTITRIFSRTDYIDFYEKYFLKHETLRKDMRIVILHYTQKRSKSSISERLLYIINRFSLDPGRYDRITYNKNFL